MTRGARRKVGWTWTVKHGWKRIPRSLRRVKKVPLPSKHRTRKKLMVSPAEPKATKTPKAPKIAAGQGRAVSAPILAPKAEKSAPPKPRKAWGGKYADLSPPEGEEGAKT
jgi:hypothetical protein